MRATSSSTARTASVISSSQVRSRTAARTWGGVGALGGALAYESGLLQAGECQIEKSVGAVVLGKALTEVGWHTVVEAGLVQLRGERVREIDTAADRFRRLPVRQTQHELQHADGGQLGGQQTGTSVARVPVGKVLVVPQPVQPVPHPRRRRTVRVARPRDLRSQKRDLLTGTGTEGPRTPQQLHRPTEQHRACPR